MKEKHKTIREKIKYIINNYGQATSEGDIYWDDNVDINDLEEYKDKKSVIGRHPLDVIVDEILELLNKRNV